MTEVDLDPDQLDGIVSHQKAVDGERSHELARADRHPGIQYTFDRLGQTVESSCERLDDRWQLEDEEVGR